MKMQKKWKYVLTGMLTAVLLAVNAWAANVIATTDVNMRRAPDNNASIVCTLRKNAKAEKLGNSGNWIHVKYNGKTGYIYKRYLKDENAQPAKKTTTVYTTGNLWVRATPDKVNGEKLGVLKKGTAVESYGKTANGWHEIRYQGKKAYISGKYVTTTKPAETAKTVTVYTTANLRVRAAATTNSKRLGVLPKGTAVTTYGKANGWYTIEYNGKTAYICAKYTTTTKPTTVKTTTVYTTADLWIRAEASMNGKKLGVMKQGTAVTTYGKANGWYEIRYNGRQAYIGAKYTTTTKPKNGLLGANGTDQTMETEELPDEVG